MIRGTTTVRAQTTSDLTTWNKSNKHYDIILNQDLILYNKEFTHNFVCHLIHYTRGPRKTPNKLPCVNIGKMGFLLRAKTGFFEFRYMLHKDLFQIKMNKNSINNKFFWWSYLCLKFRSIFWLICNNKINYYALHKDVQDFFLTKTVILLHFFGVSQGPFHKKIAPATSYTRRLSRGSPGSLHKANFHLFTWRLEAGSRGEVI
jgi:hypothetical protein